jgi:hypothetical protein
MSEMIGVGEFEDRLIKLCLAGPMTGLPRRQRDKAILLASAILWMDAGAVYTEQEVNDALGRWLENVCPSLQLDVVTMRRELVDRNYLDRDDAGRSYTAGRGPVSFRFDDRLADVDPARVIADAVEERESRRRSHMKESGTDV